MEKVTASEAIDLVSVRDAEASDISAVLSVEATGYEFPWSEAVFLDCFKENYFFLVIEIEGKVVGYSIVSEIVGEAHLLNICIDSNFYRRGLGAKLLNSTIARCVQRSCDSILLEVRESNLNAKLMYEKFGFELIGRRKNYYPSSEGREDALMFQLDLKAVKISKYV